MRSRMIVLLTSAALGCGGSDQPANTPQQTQQMQSQTPSTPAPAPRPPAFPGAEQFRLGEAVAVGGGAGAQCNKLYFGEQVVAIVQAYFHAGPGAAVRRCSGNAWADPASPTSEELSAVGVRLDGSVSAGYDALDVTTDGSLTFTSLELANRASDLSFAGRWAAYASTGTTRDAAGGQEADVIGVVYDIPGRFALQEFLLGTCQLPGSGSALTLATPTWAEDGRSLVFHGLADRCSFEEVEAHPE